MARDPEVGVWGSPVVERVRALIGVVLLLGGSV